MRRWIFLLLALLCFYKLLAQNPSLPRDCEVDSLGYSNPTNAIGASIGGAYINELRDYMANINIDYFITKKISSGITYGIFSRESGFFSGGKRDQMYSIGLKYWHKSEYRRCGTFPFFIGLSYVRFRHLDDSIIWDNYYYDSVLEVPIGMYYTTKFGLQTSLQFSYYFGGFTSQDVFGPNIELRVGWRFNFRKGKGG